MATARKHQEISPFIMKTYVVVVIVSWCINLIPPLTYALQQLPGNANFSAFYTIFLYDFFLPALLFAGFMAYRRRKTGVSRVAESLLLTLIVWHAVVATSQAVQFGLNQTQIMFDDNLDWWYLEVIVCAVSTVATLSVLIYARHLKKW